MTLADVEAARRTISGQVLRMLILLLRMSMLLKCERFNFRRHFNRPFNMSQYPLDVDI